jgi:hypothetical protein
VPSLILIRIRNGEKIMKTRAFIVFLLAVVITMLSAACTRSETTTTPSLTTPTTTQPATKSPTEEELRKLNFASPELPRITAYQLNILMNNGDPLSVVDVRLRSNYDLGHLPGALNITVACTPDPGIDEIALVKLMALPRDRLIVLY